MQAHLFAELSEACDCARAGEEGLSFLIVDVEAALPGDSAIDRLDRADDEASVAVREVEEEASTALWFRLGREDESSLLESVDVDKPRTDDEDPPEGGLARAAGPRSAGDLLRPFAGDSGGDDGRPPWIELLR